MPTPRSEYAAKSSTGPQIDFLIAGDAIALVEITPVIARTTTASRPTALSLTRWIGSPQNPNGQADDPADCEDTQRNKQRKESRREPSAAVSGD